MSTELTLLWIIASIMSCWCFSVIVRTLSDWVAIRRKRLVPQYNKKSKWIALAVFVLSTATAYFTASYAIELESEYSYDPTGFTTSIGIVSASVCVFAGFLIVWGFIGDRARGRIRCPRCWYDMSAAQNLTCPECGKEAKDKRAFTKSRRPKWPFVLATFFLSTGGYTFSVSDRVAEHEEWLAAVPTWFLMLGWDQLPENWIYLDWSSGKREYYTCLEERISYDDWTSDSAKKWFGNRLFRGMLDSQKNRWDPKRLELIDSVELQIVGYYDKEAEKFVIDNPPKYIDQVFKLAASDITDALLADSPTKLQIQIMERDSDSTPYYFIRSMYHNMIYSIDGIDDWSKAEDQTLSKCSKLLDPIKNQLLSDSFKELLIDENPTKSELAYLLVNDVNQPKEYYQTYFQYADVDHSEMLDRSFGLAFMAMSLDESEYASLFGKVTEFLLSSREEDIAFGVNTVWILQRFLRLDSNTDIPEYQTAVNNAITHGLNNHSKFNFVRIGPLSSGEEYSIHEMAMRIISSYDMSGKISFPLIEQQLHSDPENANYLNYSIENPYDASSVDLWFQHFEQFLDSDDLEVHKWIVANIPSVLDTAYDDRLDQLAVSYLNHPDEEIAENAVYKLKNRLADHLIDH
jgi:hypothetical protein